MLNRKIIVIFIILLIIGFSFQPAFCKEKIPINIESFTLRIYKNRAPYGISHKIKITSHKEGLLIDDKSFEDIVAPRDPEKTYISAGKYEYRERLKKHRQIQMDERALTQFINILNYIEFLSLPEWIEHDEVTGAGIDEFQLSYISNHKKITKKIKYRTITFKPGNKEASNICFLVSYIHDIINLRNKDGELKIWEDVK